jgi:hypothetical protein
MKGCKKLALVFAILWSVNAMALPTSVLSNLNQPSQGAYFRVGVLDRLAIPFTTDSSFTEFNGVELAANTLFGPGLFFVEIWDVDVLDNPVTSFRYYPVHQHQQVWLPIHQVSVCNR